MRGVTGYQVIRICRLLQVVPAIAGDDLQSGVLNDIVVQVAIEYGGIFQARYQFDTFNRFNFGMRRNGRGRHTDAKTDDQHLLAFSSEEERIVTDHLDGLDGIVG